MNSTQSSFLAIFPIHAPTSPERAHRQALNQLPSIVPDAVTITGEWTGHHWTDPDHRHWWIMTAPATGDTHDGALATIRQTAHHIDPQLVAWIDGHNEPSTPKMPREKRNATRPRLDQLQELLNDGTSIEDAITSCGWARARSAGAAARRAGNLTLARTLEAAA